MEDIKNIKSVAELKQYRKSINEQLDIKEYELTRLEKADKLSNQGFGFIKEAFERLVSNLYTEDKDKAVGLMKKYISEVKSNESLANLQAIYEAIRKANSSVDKDFMVNTIFEQCKKSSSKKINEDTKKVGEILKECYLAIENADELLPSNYNKAIDEAVAYVSSHNQNKNNIAEFAKAVATIKESILDNENDVEMPESDANVESMVDDFNNKYSDLDDDELDALKMDNSTESFDGVKDECIKEVEDAMENSESDEEKERMKGVHEQLSAKRYNKETFFEDVLKMKSVIGILKKK